MVRRFRDTVGSVVNLFGDTHHGSYQPPKKVSNRKSEGDLQALLKRCPNLLKARSTSNLKSFGEYVGYEESSAHKVQADSISDTTREDEPIFTIGSTDSEDTSANDQGKKSVSPSRYLTYEFIGKTLVEVLDEYEAEAEMRIESLGIEQRKPTAKPIDVLRILSDNFTRRTHTLTRLTNRSKVAINTLRDKYLIIYCFSSPSGYDVGSYVMNLMTHYYNELVIRSGGRFEMVFIVKTTNDCKKADFDDLFSGFPGLTIPFLEKGARASVCKLLGMTRAKPVVGMLLDRNHIVLQEHRFDRCLITYGDKGFPFTYDKIRSLVDTGLALEKRFSVVDNKYAQHFVPVSLADLLFSQPSDKLKRSIIGGDNDNIEHYDEITVSELGKKEIVGVYICYTAEFMSKLASMYHEIKGKGLEFEIVFLWLGSPYRPQPPPSDHGWWVLPYGSERHERLSKLCYRGGGEDTLFIVRPDGKSWERSGKPIMLYDGIIYYPFTTETMLESLSSLTVDSLLGGDSQGLTTLPYTLRNDFDSSKDVPVSRLRGKNVLVYFDCFTRCRDFSMNDWVKLLRDAQVNSRMPFEVVFVPLFWRFGAARLPFTSPGIIELLISFTEDMLSSWLMLPCNFSGMAASRVLSTEIELRECSSSGIIMAAFGKDGRIRSLCAESYLSDPAKLASVFAQDVVSKEDYRYFYDTVSRHVDYAIKAHEYGSSTRFFMS